MNEEQDSQVEQNRNQDNKEQQANPSDKHGVTHPPIIITGGGSGKLEVDSDSRVNGSSVDLEFDSYSSTSTGAHTHYQPDDVNNPTTYSAPNLRIRSVTVEVGGNTHTCSHVTANSTVVIMGKKDEFDNEPIRIIGGDGIVITFDHGEYEPNGANSGRKKFRNGIRKIGSLTIYHPGGAEAHRCPAIPANGKCIITIQDLH